VFFFFFTEEYAVERGLFFHIIYYKVFMAPATSLVAAK